MAVHVKEVGGTCVNFDPGRSPADRWYRVTRRAVVEGGRRFQTLSALPVSAASVNGLIFAFVYTETN